MNEVDLSLEYLLLYWEVVLCIGVIFMCVSVLNDRGIE